MPRALLALSGIRRWIPFNRWMDTAARRLGRDAGRSRFWPHDVTYDVDTFRGAAMFVRAAAWRDVGPLSDVTRVGFEIADWHRRCRDRGWRVVFFADAEVVHYYRTQAAGRHRMLTLEYLLGYLAYFQRHRHRAAALSYRLGAIPIAGVRWALATLGSDRAGARLWQTSLSMLLRPPATGRGP